MVPTFLYSYSLKTFTLSVSNMSLNLSKSIRHQFVFNPFLDSVPFFFFHPNPPTFVQTFVVYFLNYSGFPAFGVSLISFIPTAARVFSLNGCLVQKKKKKVIFKRKPINNRIKSQAYFSWHLGHLNHLYRLPVQQ